jgi:multidrug efflux pump subunit AcrB
MPKKRKGLAPDQQKAYEQEQLSRLVNVDGEGEAPAVQALLDPDFVKMTDLNVTDIALMLQQIVRGQNSLIAKADENAREINMLREKMARNDLTVESRMKEQRSEIEEILDRAEKLKATGMKKDQIIAQGAAQYTKAIQEARASSSISKKQFEDKLKRQPQIQVLSPGVWQNVREGQSIIPKIFPEEIRIRHLRFILQPGIPTMVPQSVAEALADRRKSQVETGKRKEMLSKQMEQTKLINEWSNVGGSKTENLPLA